MWILLKRLSSWALFLRRLKMISKAWKKCSFSIWNRLRRMLKRIKKISESLLKFCRNLTKIRRFFMISPNKNLTINTDKGSLSLSHKETFSSTMTSSQWYWTKKLYKTSFWVRSTRYLDLRAISINWWVNLSKLWRKSWNLL